MNARKVFYCCTLLLIALSNSPVSSQENADDFTITNLETGKAVEGVTEVIDKTKTVAYNVFPSACNKSQCYSCIAIDKKNPLCTYFTYIDSNYTLRISSVYQNNKTLFTHDVKVNDAQPICVPLPSAPLFKICLKVRDIEAKDKNELSACIDIMGKFSLINLFVLHFGCFKVGPKEFKFTGPKLPEDPKKGGLLAQLFNIKFK